MKFAFNQSDTDGRETVPVWESPKEGALFFSTGLHVNTDGTKRSYSVDDFWGSGTALNNLCNAMSDRCKGPRAESAVEKERRLRARRILTQKAKAEKWPTKLTQQTKIGKNIIAFKNKKPCPEVDGFLVNATALHDPNVTDVCSFSRYVDSLKTPAIVLPGREDEEVPTSFQKRGAWPGDLAVVMSADGSVLAYSVVGDTGPARNIGEGTIALAGRLLGKKNEPKNYCEVRGKSNCGGANYRGQGWDVPMAHVIIFPRTKDEEHPYMTADRIEEQARVHFDNWGGLDRLKSCVSSNR